MPYCVHCSYQYFPSDEAYQRHVRQSKDHPACPVCYEKFDDKARYEVHVRRSHPQCEYCEQCNLYFTCRITLDEHYRDSGRHARCDLCKFGFRTEEEYDNHYAELHKYEESCHLCRIDLKDDAALQDHYLHSPNHPVCTICNLGFLNDGAHTLHNSETHSALYCDQCGCAFENEIAAEEHLLNSPVHDAYQCAHCDAPEIFSSEGYLLHIEAFHSDIFCETCKRTFRDTDEIEDHYLTSPIHIAYRCTHCNTGELFQSDEGLETHIAAFHSNLVCEPCKRIFRDTKEIENHYLTSPVHVAYRCTQCKTTELFQSDADLENHITTVHSKTLCKPCKRTFRNKDEIENHLLNSPVHIAYRCTLCKSAEIFQTDKDLENHISTVHSKTVCKPCKRTFRSTKELEQHYLNSPVHIAYRCTLCDSTELFQTDEDLETHIASVHSKTVCKPCKRTFRSTKELEYHYLNSPVHIAYRCTLCHSTELFQTDKDLETHIATVHSKTVCKPCNRTFRSKDEIEQHLLNSPVHIAYRCTHCDSVEIFQTDEDYDKHLTLHLSHYCKPCKRPFHSEKDLTRHYSNSKKHPSCQFGCGVGLADNKALEEHLDLHHEKCTVCGEYFIGSVLLWEHSLNAHKNQTCTTCGKAFDDESALRDHIGWTHVTSSHLLIEVEPEETTAPPADTQRRAEMSTQTTSDTAEQSATRSKRNMVHKDAQTLPILAQDQITGDAKGPASRKASAALPALSTPGDNRKRSRSRSRKKVVKKGAAARDEPVQSRNVGDKGSVPKDTPTSPSKPSTSGADTEPLTIGETPHASPTSNGQPVDETNDSAAGKPSPQPPPPPLTSGVDSEEPKTHPEEKVVNSEPPPPPPPPPPPTDQRRAGNETSDSSDPAGTETSTPPSQPTASDVNPEPPQDDSEQQAGGNNSTASSQVESQTVDETNISAGTNPPLPRTTSPPDPQKTVADSEQQLDGENSQTTSLTQNPITSSPDPPSREHTDQRADEPPHPTPDEAKQETSNETTPSASPPRTDDKIHLESADSAETNAEGERKLKQGSSKKRTGRKQTNNQNPSDATQGGSSTTVKEAVDSSLDKKDPLPSTEQVRSSLLKGAQPATSSPAPDSATLRSKAQKKADKKKAQKKKKKGGSAFPYGESCDEASANEAQQSDAGEQCNDRVKQSERQAEGDSRLAVRVSEPPKNAAAPATDSIVSPPDANDVAPHEGTTNSPTGEGVKIAEGESGKRGKGLETPPPHGEVGNDDTVQVEQRKEREKAVLSDTTTHSTIPKPHLAVDIPSPNLWPSNMTTAVTAAASRATLTAISSSTVADVSSWFTKMSDRSNSVGSVGDNVGADGSSLTNMPNQILESENGMSTNLHSGNAENAPSSSQGEASGSAQTHNATEGEDLSTFGDTQLSAERTQQAREVVTSQHCGCGGCGENDGNAITYHQPPDVADHLSETEGSPNFESATLSQRTHENSTFIHCCGDCGDDHGNLLNTVGSIQATGVAVSSEGTAPETTAEPSELGAKATGASSTHDEKPATPYPEDKPDGTNPANGTELADSRRPETESKRDDDVLGEGKEVNVGKTTMMNDGDSGSGSQDIVHVEPETGDEALHNSNEAPADLSSDGEIISSGMHSDADIDTLASGTPEDSPRSDTFPSPEAKQSTSPDPRTVPTHDEAHAAHLDPSGNEDDGSIQKETIHSGTHEHTVNDNDYDFITNPDLASSKIHVTPKKISTVVHSTPRKQAPLLRTPVLERLPGGFDDDWF